MGPGSAELSTDLSVELLVSEPGPDWERAVRHAADEISARLARRMSRGIQITAASLFAGVGGYPQRGRLSAAWAETGPVAGCDPQ
jgi:hypothetical protein